MGKLERYDSKLSMTTEPGMVKKDLATEAAFGKDLVKFGGAVVDVAKKWQDAKDASEILTRKNQITEELYKLEKEASEDRNHENIDTYYARLEELRNNVGGGFSSKMGQKEFSLFANTELRATRERIDGTYRGKLLKHSEGEMIASRRINKDIHIKDKNPAKADRAKAEHMRELLRLRDANLINEVAFQKELVEMDGWGAKRQDYQLRGRIADAPGLVEAEILEGKKYPDLEGKERLEYLTLAKQRKAYIKAEEEARVEASQLLNEGDVGENIENLSAPEILEMMENNEISPETGIAVYDIKTDPAHARAAGMDPDALNQPEGKDIINGLRERMVSPGEQYKSIKKVLSQGVRDKKIDVGQMVSFLQRIKDHYGKAQSLYVKDTEQVKDHLNWLKKIRENIENNVPDGYTATEAVYDAYEVFDAAVDGGIGFAEAGKKAVAAGWKRAFDWFSAVPEEGQLRIDANGNKAMVYPDRIEEIE